VVAGPFWGSECHSPHALLPCGDTRPNFEPRGRPLKTDCPPPLVLSFSARLQGSHIGLPFASPLSLLSWDANSADPLVSSKGLPEGSPPPPLATSAFSSLSFQTRTALSDDPVEARLACSTGSEEPAGGLQDPIPLARLPGIIFGKP
jgi:hypothetical protein